MTQLAARNARQNRVAWRRRRRRARVGVGVVGCLPRVWAVAAAGLPRCSAASAPPYYRRYTQALLRRYMRLSLEAGRVPSLMGREMFRGNVTHYRVRNFEDVVIFCHDVEKRLAQLTPLDQQLVKRIGLQQYTQGEAAAMLSISLRHCVRLYAETLDRLTVLFLEDRLLEPQNGCQGGTP